MQAKHINKIELIRDININKNPYGFTNIYNLNFLNIFPRKVVFAKIKKLIKKGLIEGCTCGCRGDLSITKKGQIFLDNN